MIALRCGRVEILRCALFTRGLANGCLCMCNLIHPFMPRVSTHGVHTSALLHMSASQCLLFLGAPNATIRDSTTRVIIPSISRVQ